MTFSRFARSLAFVAATAEAALAFPASAATAPPSYTSCSLLVFQHKQLTPACSKAYPALVPAAPGRGSSISGHSLGTSAGKTTSTTANAAGVTYEGGFAVHDVAARQAGCTSTIYPGAVIISSYLTLYTEIGDVKSLAFMHKHGEVNFYAVCRFYAYNKGYNPVTNGTVTPFVLRGLPGGQ